MTLTEELDMVGVELQATWTATRKTNGDALQNRIVKKTNFWKGGKIHATKYERWFNKYILFLHSMVQVPLCGSESHGHFKN